MLLAESDYLILLPIITPDIKTPFIYNFGENNTFEHLDVEGKIRQGKYTVTNGNIKFDFGGAEENYQIKGDKIIPRGKTTSALLVKKINGNLLKGNQYTGILYNLKSKAAIHTTYHFIADKLGLSDENSKAVPFGDYTLVGNMAGYKWYGPGGVKSLLSHRFFVLYGTQMVVINIYKNQSQGATSFLLLCETSVPNL
ncbi:MAG: hypothetical protein WC623_12015 [Pedobacter sp.]|uniref:hypothetical protein n=1 Tax=Pedobacter sp. TaxID=1411316 RepID=UPI003562388A